jgi:uncharacterized membrane protein
MEHSDPERIQSSSYPRISDLDLFLLPVAILTMGLVVFLPPFSDSGLRPAITITYLLFVPGYALAAVLFVRKNDLDRLERTAFSFGLSLAIVSLLGLILSSSSWGATIESMIASLLAFTLLVTPVAYIRRHVLAKDERFAIRINKNLSKQIHAFALANSSSPQRKVLFCSLIIAIAFTAAIASYAVVLPKQEAGSTEFYILNSNGKAEDYPTNFSLGDHKLVTVGMSNHEYAKTTYSLIINLNDSGNVTRLNSSGITLNDGQKWQQAIDLFPNHVGDNMKIEFLLYAGQDLTNPYQECHLWVNVVNRSTT